MIKKTHLAIGLAIGLYFLSFVNHKFSFIPIVLIASLLPDIDSMSSSFGRRVIFRPVQVLFIHRGPLHSYTFCALFAFLFTLFYPVAALPFFLGYSFHIFADSFTVQGIRPFWPLKFQSSGVLRSGGIADRTLFGVFIIIDLVLFVMLFV